MINWNWGQIDSIGISGKVLQSPAHPRNENGHLICQGRCHEPYPYAEPPPSGEFICYSCRLGLGVEAEK